MSGFVAPPPRQTVRALPGPPAFSIAIAAYQAAATIAETLESALAQTLPAAEIVVCDDGSTDDLAAAVAPYRDRVTVIRQGNRGDAAAKNAAAAATTGDFVAFLDADDVYLPTRLERLGELAAARPDLDVLTTNAELEAGGRIVGRYYPDVATFPAEDQVAGVVASDSAVLSSAAVRRSAWLGAGGFTETLRSSADWELWMRLVLAGSAFGLVDEPLYRYRLHERGLSADQVTGSWDNVSALERVLPLAAGDARAHVERSLARHRALAALTEAEAALRADPAHGRSRSWAIARGGYPARTRVKAGLAAAFPRTAARLLQRRSSSRTRKPMPGR
jgi:glycosyltransferase involved in cell wall biosynthesis